LFRRQRAGAERPALFARAPRQVERFGPQILEVTLPALIDVDEDRRSVLGARRDDSLQEVLQGGARLAATTVKQERVLFILDADANPPLVASDLGLDGSVKPHLPKQLAHTIGDLGGRAGSRAWRLFWAGNWRRNHRLAHGRGDRFGRLGPSRRRRGSRRRARPRRAHRDVLLDDFLVEVLAPGNAHAKRGRLAQAEERAMPLLEDLDLDLVRVAAEDLEGVLDGFVDGGAEGLGVLELDQLFLTAPAATGRARAARRGRARSAGRLRGRCARRRHASSLRVTKPWLGGFGFHGPLAVRHDVLLGGGQEIGDGP